MPYPRHPYKEIDLNVSHLTDSFVASKKFDGAHFFGVINPDGTMNLISRRPSVKGGFPDRTASLPHLANINLPQYAGTVLSFELHHTGKTPHNPESHRQVSAILNSLPERAISTQEALGPVRAAMLNVIHPKLQTYREKIEYMKGIERAVGRPDILFVPEFYQGAEKIKDLIEKTKAENLEGVIITHLDRPEHDNPRFKIKHQITYNLKITGMLQEVDIHGNPKHSMGAALCSDATETEVAAVGTGWSKAQRKDMWENQDKYLGSLIQVKTMGVAKHRLRMPVYNGSADGDLDIVPIQ